MGTYGRISVPGACSPRGLAIDGVKAGGAAVEHALGPADPILGAPLTIALPDGVDRVEIGYRTGPNASALQWLDPRRTAGGRQPFRIHFAPAVHANVWQHARGDKGVEICGVLVGFWFARQPLVAAVFDPYVKMINALPRVVLAPIFALWLGLGITGRPAFG